MHRTTTILSNMNQNKICAACGTQFPMNPSDARLQRVPTYYLYELNKAFATPLVALIILCQKITVRICALATGSDPGSRV